MFETFDIYIRKWKSWARAIPQWWGTCLVFKRLWLQSLALPKRKKIEIPYDLPTPPLTTK